MARFLHPALRGIRTNAPIPRGCKTGLTPRDFKSRPQGFYAHAPAFPASLMIDKAEWPDRLNEQQKNKSSLLDLRTLHYDALQSLDQNGYGLCWAFSSTKACMYTRARANQPVFPLSAWYVAGNIKGWRDEGGWGAASSEFIATHGVPAMEKCPKYSRSAVAADADQNAALHKFTQWYDGPEDSMEAQAVAISMALQNWPTVIDLNVMGHSMCMIAIKSLNPVTFVYDNSWGTKGNEQGLYIGTGAYAQPNGLVCPLVSGISVV